MQATQQKPLMVVGTSAPHRRDMTEKAYGARYEIVCISPDIDEKAVRCRDAYELTRQIALRKMDAVIAAAADDESLVRRLRDSRGSVAVTFDQVVVWQGQIREKPETPDEARAFISSYSNSTLDTVQTTALHHFDTGVTDTRANRTSTRYGVLSAAVVDAVVERGVCMRTAGAFVVEDADMQRAMVGIDPGTTEEVQGFCVASIDYLLNPDSP